MSSSIAATELAVTYRSIRVDNLDIFYRESGPKDGPILLLHGLPSSSRMFQPLLESSLNENYHLIAPDYPGFGHSSRHSVPFAVLLGRSGRARSRGPD
jgi:pimeloyl-ACP methyl ester carboxylesterase